MILMSSHSGIVALGQTPMPEINSWIDQLSSKQVRTRQRAASELRKAAAKMPTIAAAAIPTLWAALLDEDPWVTIMAADALAVIGEPARSAIPTMVKLLASPNADIRGYIALALARLKPVSDEILTALLRLLEDPGKCRFQQKKNCYPIRYRVAFAIAQIAPTRPEILPVIRDALLNTNLWYVFSEAITCVRDLGVNGVSLIPDIRGLLVHHHEWRRFRANLFLLGVDPQFVPTLEYMDKPKDLRDTCERAFGVEHSSESRKNSRQ